MNLVKRTALTLIVNLLIIVSFFVFVNCFGKQEIWPLVVSGIFLLAFLLIKLSSIGKESSRSSSRYYR